MNRARFEKSKDLFECLEVRDEEREREFLRQKLIERTAVAERAEKRAAVLSEKLQKQTEAYLKELTSLKQEISRMRASHAPSSFEEVEAPQLSWYIPELSLEDPDG